MQCTFTASRPTPRLYSMDPYSSSFSSLLSLLITLFFLNMHQPSTSSASTTPHFSKIYAFGDSYTDTGNTQSSTGPTSYAYVSNPPYGMTFFHRPTNRYSDGRLVVDFLTTNLSLPFLPPYRSRNADFSHGSNFAVAGSTAIRHEFYVENNITINTTPQSLGTELGWLEEFLVRNRRTVVEEDSLIWVGEMGANDYAYSFFSSVPRSSIQQLAIKSLTGFLQAMLEKGAKYMVVQGLPLLGCLPLSLYLAPENDRDSMGCVASANQQAHSHNALLQEKLEELRKLYPEAFISYADFWNAHLAVMKKPAAYGIAETLKTCCGAGGGPYNFQVFSTCGSPAVPEACAEPAKFVNWDGVHFTEAMNKAAAHMFFHGGYCRPSFQLLLQSKRRGG